jgi:hypothetical protein
MPVPVKVYTWDPRMDEMALNELDWTMFELPAPGSHYWHDRWGYTVREVDETQDPPHVHLVHDRAYEEELHAGLPDGYLLDGGRDSEDGSWHFFMLTPQGRPLGPFRGGDFDSAVGQALAAAAEHARAQAGQV